MQFAIFLNKLVKYAAVAQKSANKCDKYVKWHFNAWSSGTVFTAGGGLV